MSSTKQPPSELTLASYWMLRRAPKIPELRRRLLATLEEGITMKVVFTAPIDWEKSVKRVCGLTTIPFQQEIERELECDLSIARCFLDQEMLQSLRRDWLVQGHRIYFREIKPSYDIVLQAVCEFLVRQPLWER